MAELLWKRLFLSDHNNMHGRSAPKGGGGGATYIVLGKTLPKFNWAGFFPPLDDGRIVISTATGPFTVTSNPGRRKGEWLIVDQHNNRHQAWGANAGFPDAYEKENPPVVLLFKIDGAYHVGWLPQQGFAALAAELAGKVKGVAEAPAALLAQFGLDGKTMLQKFNETAPALAADDFDPANREDGRKRIIAAVVRRQGQKAFRAALMDCYAGKCAITGCADTWVLQAAHISPFSGRIRML